MKKAGQLGATLTFLILPLAGCRHEQKAGRPPKTIEVTIIDTGRVSTKDEDHRVKGGDTVTWDVKQGDKQTYYVCFENHSVCVNSPDSLLVSAGKPNSCELTKNLGTQEDYAVVLNQAACPSPTAAPPKLSCAVGSHCNGCFLCPDQSQ